MKPTIQDVARLSGVSVATVSRILNGLDGYSPETKIKVNEVIGRLGYRPNAVARGLVNRSTRTLGVLLPCVTEKFATLLLEGIEATAHRMGYSVIICNTDSNGRRTMDYLRVLAEKQTDGIIFASEWITDEYGHELTGMKVPVVLVSTYSTKFPFPFVRVDDGLASYHAVKFLIEKGHKHIGMVSGTYADPVAGKPRVEGWRQAMLDHGLPAEDRQLVFGDFYFHSGKAAAASLCASFPEMTAVFAASDEMAMGVLSHAFESGIKVPDDLSVVGYDDTSLADMGIPPLTSVHQPVHDMGEKAVEILLRTGPASSLVMPFSITERASVKTIR